MIVPATLDGDEKLLYNKTLEQFKKGETNINGEFSAFLNPRQQAITKTVVGDKGLYFGGFRGAQRQMLGVFPQYILEDNPEGTVFPIAAVKIIHKRDETLNHRWVLGSITGIGISRDHLGDILPEQGSCVVVCTKNVQAVLIHELVRIGSIGVKTVSQELIGLQSKQQYEKVTGTISSVRLDNLVSLVTKISRGKTLELFKSGRVQHNYSIAEKPAVIFGAGDVITIRGYGKYIVDEIGGPTRKGRLTVECRKYI